MRIRAWWWVAAVVWLLQACATTPRPATDDSWIFAILPDTQLYARSHPDIFAAQTRWLGEHGQELGAPFVLHLGDVVQRPEHADQWRTASSAMRTLEDAGLSYAIAPGNHDVLDPDEIDRWRDHPSEPYPERFSPDRAAQQAGFVARGPFGFSEAYRVARNGETVLVLALGWRPGAETLAWAESLLAAHPSTPTIVITHALLVPGEEEPTIGSLAGPLWQAFLRHHDQILMVLNGHYAGDAWRIEPNAAGHPVLLAVIDYQHLDHGGGGYLQLWRLDFDDEAIETLALSPWVQDPLDADDPTAPGLVPPFGEPIRRIPFPLTRRWAQIRDQAPGSVPVDGPAAWQRLRARLRQASAMRSEDAGR
ncbi:metallophosphoesterase [uncultured Abyssibacter sp.]|uniref:metallophosphoesterase n=1 Tax=uncultured Abyssibacter sp. TaxID=2320202 RepID=UPI0032B1316B